MGFIANNNRQVLRQVYWCVIMMWSEETTAGDQGPAFSVYLMHSSRESNTFLNLGGFLDSVVTWMRSELQPPNWFVLSDLKLKLSLTNKNPKNGMGRCWQSYYSLQPLLLWGVRKKKYPGEKKSREVADLAWWHLEAWSIQPRQDMIMLYFVNPTW